MDIRELRIGNLVAVNELNYCIVYGVAANKNGWTIDPEPIPLTPEILEKAGFKKEEGLVGYEKEEIYGSLMNPYDNQWFLWIDGGYVNQEGTLLYVHQLQNLYWCLTGKELNIGL